MSNPLANELHAILATPAEEARTILARLGVPASAFAPHGLACRSPITGEVIAHLAGMRGPPTSRRRSRAPRPPSSPGGRCRHPAEASSCGSSARSCAPPRSDLGRLVTIEAGKIVSEGLGEVQEMIDICDFAVGLSRQLHGLTIATERPGHRMMETWHPLGVCGVITRLQLPGRGLVVERGARLRLRQSGRVEALGKDAAFGARGARRSSSARRSASARCRTACARCSSAGARWARRWSTTSVWRWSRRPARPRWAGRRRRASRGASPAPSSSSAATTPRS